MTNERLVNCERVLFFWEKSYDITINCLYCSLQNLFRLEYLRIELFWSIRTRAHHYYWPSATTIGWSYPLNCYPVSHREPRIVWSITSLSWTTRLYLCHDPAGHPRRDANMGVKFAIGRDIFGFWYIVSSIRIRERVRRNWWRGKVAREVVELLRGEFWSFIEEFGISKRGYWERTRSLRES